MWRVKINLGMVRDKRFDLQFGVSKGVTVAYRGIISSARASTSRLCPCGTARQESVVFVVVTEYLVTCKA